MMDTRYNNFIFGCTMTSSPTAFGPRPPSFRVQAWAAFAALVCFFVLYGLLIGWLGRTAWRLGRGILLGTGSFGTFVAMGCATFTLIFLVKGLFWRRMPAQGPRIKVTAEQQPRLVAFLHSLADTVGAPRPHQIHLVPGVNACVYDHVGFWNLFFPRKKHLDIGLGLVNSLSLGTFRAVCAHEFGHFAQATTIVGRWADISQQVAQRIVFKRDGLDAFLDGLSRIDIRFAWIGWLLKGVIWALRALVETALTLVMLAHRSLSRGMEHQADHVAAGVTGSDALVFALHRLQQADEDWDRAVAFIKRFAGQQKAVPNAYAIHARIQTHMRTLLNEPRYGVDPVPTGPEGMVFKPTLATPPRMWATHPLNHEREAQIRRFHAPRPVDAAPAWDLFDQPETLSQAMTSQLYTGEGLTCVAGEQALEALDQAYRREHMNARYRGLYLKRACTRAFPSPTQLYGTFQQLPLAFETLYPKEVAEAHHRLGHLGTELSALERILDGSFKPTDGVIRSQGRVLSMREVAPTITKLQAEIMMLQEQLHTHDSRVRGMHLKAANLLGAAWEARLRGLGQVLHGTEHAWANVEDVHRFLHAELSLATAMRGSQEKRFLRALAAAESAQGVLESVFCEAPRVQLDPGLQEALGSTSWAAHLGELGLRPPRRENLQDWLQHVDGWFQHAALALETLALHALDALLEAERQVSEAVTHPTTKPIVPPEAPSVQGPITAFPLGREREIQRQLTGIDHLLAAQGWLPQGGRLLAAGAILWGVQLAASGITRVPLTVLNDLDIAVTVTIAEEALRLPPHGHETVQVAQGETVAVSTHLQTGPPVEAFAAQVEGAHTVYNVASAGVLLEWTAVYGGSQVPPERPLGTPRWFATRAEDVFVEPPTQVRKQEAGSTRLALKNVEQAHLVDLFGSVDRAEDQRAMILAHARFDQLEAPNTPQWLVLAAHTPGGKSIIEQRLTLNPTDLSLLRAQQEVESDLGKRQAMAKEQIRKAGSSFAPADAFYLLTRAMPEGEVQDQAFLEGERRFPTHPWLAYAAGSVHAASQRWERAETCWRIAARGHRGLEAVLRDERARLAHLAQGFVVLDASHPLSARLQLMVQVEGGNAEQSPALAPHVSLAQGRLEEALQASRSTPLAAHFLRMAAASEGAKASLIQKALALPADQGIDTVSLPYALALAMREKADPTALITQLRTLNPNTGDRVVTFLQKAAAGQFAEAEQTLGRMEPFQRGQCHAAGLVLLGKRAPRTWSRTALGLTFAPERPFLGR